MAPRPHKSSAKSKILDAALMVIRCKGYTATTVDDLCAASDVTKGAFFHHFKSKDDLAVAAVEHWSKVTGELFETAPYHRHQEPLQRVLGYLEFRKSLLTGEVAEFTCLVGTMVQETFEFEPGHSSRLRCQHQRARAEDRNRHRRGDAATRPSPAVVRKKPRPAHASGSTGRVHIG